MNYVTAPRIAAIEAEKSRAAMEEVLPAESYEEVSYTGGDSMVTAVYRAGDAGYVVEVAPSGFGGAINMMVGVDTSGTVTGVSIVSHEETSGLGANATREEFPQASLWARRALWPSPRTAAPSTPSPAPLSPPALFPTV